MTRISTSMISQNALLDLQRAQKSLFTTSSQTASQKKASDVEGYGASTQTLVSANRMIARIESRIEVGAEFDTRLTIQDSALDRSAEAVSNLRQALVEAVGLNSGVSVETEMREAFSALKDSFNTNLGGRYLFGGTLNENPPVSAANLADLAAQPLTSSIEQNAQAQVVRIDAVQEIEIAPVASDLANEAFDVLRRLQTFLTGATGPFDTPMTTAQSDALKAEIGNLDAVYDTMVQGQGANGRAHNLVETAINRQGMQLNALRESVGEITDVDLAEVAVRLNEAQLSYQASASVFNTLRGLSLLEVL